MYQAPNLIIYRKSRTSSSKDLQEWCRWSDSIDRNWSCHCLIDYFCTSAKRIRMLSQFLEDAKVIEAWVYMPQEQNVNSYLLGCTGLSQCGLIESTRFRIRPRCLDRERLQIVHLQRFVNAPWYQSWSRYKHEYDETKIRRCTSAFDEYLIEFKERKSGRRIPSLTTKSLFWKRISMSSMTLSSHAMISMGSSSPTMLLWMYCRAASSIDWRVTRFKALSATDEGEGTFFFEFVLLLALLERFLDDILCEISWYLEIFEHGWWQG